MIVTLSQCVGKGYVVSKSGRCLRCHNESEREIPVLSTIGGQGATLSQRENNGYIFHHNRAITMLLPWAGGCYVVTMSERCPRYHRDSAMATLSPWAAMTTLSKWEGSGCFVTMRGQWLCCNYEWPITLSPWEYNGMLSPTASDDYVFTIKGQCYVVNIKWVMATLSPWEVSTTLSKWAGDG